MLKICRRIRYRIRHNRKLALLPLFLLLSACLCVFTLAKLHGMIVELASNRVKNEVTALVSRLVLEESEEIDYTKLIEFEKNEKGNVNALISNTAYINYLQSELTGQITQGVDSLALTDLGVPVGSLFKSAVISGRGPSIPVKILSANSASVRFVSGFDSTGINQTRHSLYLAVSVEIDLHTVGQKLHTGVEMNIPIAETVLIGDVPESYMYFESDDNWDEALEQYDILS